MVKLVIFSSFSTNNPTVPFHHGPKRNLNLLTILKIGKKKVRIESWNGNVGKFTLNMHRYQKGVITGKSLMLKITEGFMCEINA